MTRLSALQNSSENHPSSFMACVPGISVGFVNLLIQTIPAAQMQPSFRDGKVCTKKSNCQEITSGPLNFLFTG
jgi:hypothetical protein